MSRRNFNRAMTGSLLIVGLSAISGEIAAKPMTAGVHSDRAIRAEHCQSVATTNVIDPLVIKCLEADDGPGRAVDNIADSIGHAANGTISIHDPISKLTTYQVNESAAAANVVTNINEVGVSGAITGALIGGVVDLCLLGAISRFGRKESKTTYFNPK